MSELPEPLIAADVDLRSFPYMPLDVVRLRDSDIAAVVSAEAFRAAVILWCAAWHQVPASSLPSDDPALARLAGYGRDLVGWKSVRDEALRGFVLCSDSRFYHRVIADKAVTAWTSKQALKAKTEAATAARIARCEERRRDVERDGNRDVDRDGARDVHQQNITEQNIKNMRSEERASVSLKATEGKAAKPRRHPFPEDAFALWYEKYPRKKARQDAEKAFRTVEKADETAFQALLNGIDAFWRENPDTAFWPYPATWLNGRRWLDEPSSAKRGTCPKNDDRIDFGGGVHWSESAVRSQVERWRENPASWPDGTLGPAPDRPDCRVPEHLIARAA